MLHADEETYTQHHAYLFTVAYRMLGSVMDAEDIVQEAFLRWGDVDATGVESPRAYLTTVVTRLCIDHLRSARVRREEYVGPWLPEPLLTGEVGDAGEPALLAESLSMAFLVLLESLTPVERAVFLLREAFGYEHAEIARIVGVSEVACRQTARRARQYVESRRPRFDPSPEQQRGLTERFVHACATGDLETLLSLLADDITLWSDGGGKVRAALNPIHGAGNVARFLLGVLSKAPPGFTARLAFINGEPGIVTEAAGDIIGATTLQIADGRIAGIRVVVNPEKLRGLAV